MIKLIKINKFFASSGVMLALGIFFQVAAAEQGHERASQRGTSEYGEVDVRELGASEASDYKDKARKGTFHGNGGITISGFHSAHGGSDDHDEPAKGPHRGRLLEQNGFVVELAIFERGVPPEYRAWAIKDGSSINPGEWSLNVTLERLGGEMDHFSFSPLNDFLLGRGVVREPHSFDVRVEAQYQGQSYQWEYESHEGRVEINSEIASAMGVRSDVAKAGNIAELIRVYGRIVPIPQNTHHVQARFPGLVKRVYVQSGDKVKAGQLVAEVEANESLKRYPVRATIGGTVVDRHVNPGELAGEEPLFTIVNHDQVWLDIKLFPSHISKIKTQQLVSARWEGSELSGKIDHLHYGMEGGFNTHARAILDNQKHQLPLGLIMETEVLIGERHVPLLVDNRALQSFRDWTVVFIKIGNTYEIRPLELGSTDGRFTEVLEGLNPGDNYVVENSYLLKADLEKSGASHDH